MAASTYGVATLLASAYHDNDHETFDMISRSIELGTLVASTFQLAHMLLVSIPGGRVSSNLRSDEIHTADRPFDIRPEAIEYFDNYISENSVKAAAFSGSDPLYMTTAISTVVMGSLLPMLEEKEPPAINIEQEGLDSKGFLVVIAAIAEASIQAFCEYIELTDLFPELGKNPDYASATTRLLSLVPRVQFLLESKGYHNI